MFFQRYRGGMSYKRVSNAGDMMRHRCGLRIECTSCGQASTMTSLEVYQLHGARALAQLTRRLRCKRCGKKAAKTVVLDPIYRD
jgi:ribosomal protein L44E